MQTGMEPGNRDQRIEAIAEHAGYLLENECGLPKDKFLSASATALRASIADLLRRGEIDEGEMQFMLAMAIDIMPEQDLAAAARAQGFGSNSVDRIERAHSNVIAAMRAGREALKD